MVTPPIQGSVYGGHAPLVGAQVYVLTPSLTALYGQSASLMDGDTQNAGLTPSGTSNGLVSAGGTNGYHYVTTDLSGGFSLSGDYACTVNQAVYLVAVGGSPTYPSGTNIFNIAGANGATAGSATETAIGGTVTNIAITAAGSGLVNGTYTVDATGGGGSGAVASVVVSGNKVTSVTITDAGTGYTSAPTFTSTAWNPFIGAHTEPTLTATVSTIYDDIQFTVSTTNVAGQAGPPELFSIGETVDFSGLTGTLATVVGSSGAVIATGLTTTTFDVQVSPGTAGLTTGSTSLPVAAGATATGVPTANPAAINMTALGLCPSSGSFAGSVSYIFMNEVSTAAMAIATAAFGNGPFNVGVKTGGTVDAHLANYDANGLKQALNNASLLYDFTGTNVSTTYAGEGHIARSVTPAGNGIVPQALMDTWGNILAACVDSKNTGSGTLASPECALLFSTATSTGIACTISSGGITCPDGTTAPTDIATAAYNIAHFPAGTATTVGTNPAFVNTLYTLPTGNPPFAPNLVSTGAGQPNDFSVSIAFFVPSAAGGTNNLISGPQVISINGGNYVGNESGYTGDANGEIQQSVWVGSFFTQAVKLYANGGAPDYATNTALASAGTVDTRSVVIDGSNNVWMNQQQGASSKEFSVTGTNIQNFTPTAGNGDALGDPIDGAIDGSGTNYNLYIAGYSSNDVVKVAVVNGTTPSMTNEEADNAAGTAAFSTSTAKTGSGTAACVAASTTFAFTPTGTLFLNSDSNNGNGGGTDSSYLCTLNTTTGASIASTSGAGFFYQNVGEGPATVATDSNGVAWIGGGQTNASPAVSEGVFSVTSAGVKTAYTGGGTNDPCSVAVDGANNIWVGNAGTYGVSLFTNAGVALSPVANTGAYANAYGGFNPQIESTYALNGTTYFNPAGTASNCASPAIDRAGDIWMAYQGSGSYKPGVIFEILGIAAPVVSPRAYATFGNGATGFLGTRPY